MAQPLVTVKVEGLEALNKKLLALNDKLVTRSLSSAVGAGAILIRQAARQLAPEWHGRVSDGHPPPGTLKRAIISKFVNEQSTYFSRTWIVTVRRGKKYQKQGKGGTKSQDAYYWWFVENGHYYAAHGSANSNRKARKLGNTPGGVFVPGKYYMRDAFSNTKQAALAAIIEKLADNVEKLAEEK